MVVVVVVVVAVVVVVVVWRSVVPAVLFLLFLCKLSDCLSGWNGTPTSSCV